MRRGRLQAAQRTRCVLGPGIDRRLGCAGRRRGTRRKRQLLAAPRLLAPGGLQQRRLQCRECLPGAAGAEMLLAMLLAELLWLLLLRTLLYVLLLEVLLLSRVR